MNEKIKIKAKRTLGKITSKWLKNNQARSCILGFHSVEPNSRSALPPEIFEPMMRYLKDHWLVVPLSNILKEPADKKVAITFDDGYESVFQFVYPIMKKLELPFTLFLTTAPLEGEARVPIDGLHYCNYMTDKFLTWKQVRLMAPLIEVEAHTHHHVYCLNPWHTALREDIKTNIDVIEKRTGKRPIALAYPGGSLYHFHSSMAMLLRDLGISYGLSGAFGTLQMGGWPYACPRIPIESATTLDDFIEKINGEWDFLHGLERLRALKAPSLGNW